MYIIFVIRVICLFFFFFNDTATTEIYTLSLHDALPIWCFERAVEHDPGFALAHWGIAYAIGPNYNKQWEAFDPRSEEHTSELQSRQYLVCRLLLEKKKKSRNK